MLVLVLWLTLCGHSVVALATDVATAAACGMPDAIEYALENATVREPASITTSLHRAPVEHLRSVADVAELDPSEAAELFDELRAVAIPLGDRSRLRNLAVAQAR
jgi:hypothetical protein